MTLTEIFIGLAILVGLVGILVPILPGSILILVAVLVWAAEVGTTQSWIVASIAAALLVLGAIVKYVVPGRRLRNEGVPASTQFFGIALGVVGFFVIPVVGLLIGFVLGVYLAERRRVGAPQAWPSTKAALKAVGVSILIELVAALLATGVWLFGVFA